MLALLRRRWWLVLLAGLVLLLLAGTRIGTFYTDVLWYDAVGFGNVFWTVLRTQALLAAVAGLLMTALLGGNLLLAWRLAPPYRATSPQEEAIERYRQAVLPYVRPLLIGVAVFVGAIAAVSMVRQWPTYLLWANATAFGRTDPQFGRDLGYFVFTLPFHALVNSWLFSTLALVIVATAVAHYLFGGLRPQARGARITPQANVHLSVLLAALVAVRAWGFRLDQFMLSYSERGQVTGLSYTDVNAQLRAYQLLALIAAVTVVLFLLNIRFRGFLLPAAGVGILVVAWVVLGWVYPAVIQRFQVEPQEFARERQFIERHLETTRFAYGIDDVTTALFPADDELSGAELADNRETLESIRLWDPATLQPNYEQLQEFRTFYDFRDVDVGRYRIDGELTQVMVSAREISEAGLPEDRRNWTNQRLVYTHGIGMVSSAVSTASPDGSPVFLVRDIPPQGVEELVPDNPRIYFGERSPRYSIVDTEQLELDFLDEESQTPETTVYDGEDGVGVGTLGRRLAFALRYTEPNILLSDLLTPSSRVLFNRDVTARVQSVAPFLSLDHDPYPVTVDGRIQWVLDAYTMTDMVPYSQRRQLADMTQVEVIALESVRTDEGGIEVREVVEQVPAQRGRVNYMRNSIKAVVDAYDGTVTLYVADEQDPIIRAWQAAFPGSFTPITEAPEALRAHFRYPEDLFRVQSELYRTYHIDAAEDFFQGADAWKLPRDAAFFANQSTTIESRRRTRTFRPYYQLMRLPGEEQEEFALIQPFAPAGERENLTALLVAGSGPEQYGRLLAYRMPPNRTVEGIEQVQAEIDQDDAVSAQITLWDRSGSSVIRGNLLAIPIADALLYVQPLFLRAEQSEFPALQRVVLVFGEHIVLATSLQSGLVEIFGPAAPAIAVPGGEAGPAEPGGQAVVDPRVVELLAQAEARFEEAQAALEAGDLGGYQAANEQAAELLAEAQALLGAQPDEPPAEPTDAATPAG